MWFLDRIISYLAFISDRFSDAYQEVKGWIFPFHYLSYPLYHLYAAFRYIALYTGYFNEWLDYAAAKLSKVLDIEQLTAYFRTWINYAVDAWNWIRDAWRNVTGIIAAWWESKKPEVLAWIAEAGRWLSERLDASQRWLAALQAAWDEWKAKIPSWNEVWSWFRDWWGNTLRNLTTWWNERLRDIDALFNSRMKEWAPFWAGWQDIRTKVFEFFNDPLEFLWVKFADWFLGAE